MKYFLLILLCCSVSAADFSRVEAEINQELKTLNTALDTQRRVRFTERQKLMREIAVGEAALEKMKSDSGDRSRSLDQYLLEIVQLENEITQSERLISNVDKTLTQIRREFEALIPQEKRSLYSDGLQTFDKSPSANSIMQLILSVIDDGFRIRVFETEALNDSGVKSSARMLSLSHSLNYLKVGSQGGLAEITPDHDLPFSREMPGVAAAVEKLAAGTESSLPFDFTQGLAFKKEAAGKTLLEHIKAGGVIIYPLSILALLCLCTGLYKTVQLYVIRSQYDDKVSQLVSLIKDGKIQEAEEFVAGLKDPVRSLLADALKHHRESRINLEEILNETILSQLPRLDRFLPILSVSAGAAPLLGLLGTVMGIIKTFEMISIYGTGEANRMAGGISEALVTTEAGLIVAIPALIWYAVLSRRLKAIVSNLEKAMLGFINSVSVSEKESDS